MMTSEPSRRIFSSTCPVSGLPRLRARRRLLDAVRDRRCAAGARTAAASTRAPAGRSRCSRRRRRARLACRCRHRLGARCAASRGTCRWNGTMRVCMRPLCKSEVTRACCVSNVSASFVRPCKQLVDARDVVRRFRERARELLNRRVAVELERIEAALDRRRRPDAGAESAPRSRPRACAAARAAATPCRRARPSGTRSSAAAGSAATGKC